MAPPNPFGHTAKRPEGAVLETRCVINRVAIDVRHEEVKVAGHSLVDAGFERVWLPLAPLNKVSIIARP
jgi:hypothetical protein